MTETEQKLIDDLRPRLDNWRRAYRDRVVKNVSIAYAVEKALALTRNKTDFSEDYSGPDDRSEDFAMKVDQKDAALLNLVWQYLDVPGADFFTIGEGGLTVKTAKNIILLYVFSNNYALRRAGRKIWKVKDVKLEGWIKESLIFFALRLRAYEAAKDKAEKQ